MAEGTGLEPYSPCQGLTRGQGGLQDVQACVDLAIQFPTAWAHEHFAHPPSAPSATHWAGLTRPGRIDLDYRDALKGSLVFDLTVNLPTGPGRKAAIHSTGMPPEAAQVDVLEDDDSLVLPCQLDKALRNPVESLNYTTAFPEALASQETAPDPSVARLLSTKPSPTSKMCFLNPPDAA